MALLRWHIDAGPLTREALTRMARRIRLGDDLAGAISSLRPELGAEAEDLALLFTIHGDCGGDLASLIETTAAALEERNRLLSVAAASGAGAILSSRMVAALPLLCVPLLPVSHAPLFDPLGVALLAAGAALALAGLHWIGRLVPQPPESDDPIAAVAELVASVLSAGVGLRQALDHIALRAPAEILDRFAGAQRRVALGSTWPEALKASPHPDVSALGASLLTAQRLGVPAAAALRSFAGRLRDRRALAFDAKIRRAPVLMVVPLVTCVLPSFLLLALGPFIRGLSLG
jgi:Flp pilus assembly protein TadB